MPQSNTTHLYGGIEAGGTKFYCIVASGPDDIRARIRIPTAAPAQTLPKVIEFFRGHSLASAGLACFGPIDVDPESTTRGFITNTPKSAWMNCNILRELRAGLGVPVAFHTDVVGAALAEARWGAGAGKRGVLYVTVGTGIGGGFIYDGKPLASALHGELGHIYIPKNANDLFAGVCPYHASCLEGLASGPSILRRWGAAAETLPPEHPAWDLEAQYLAFALVNYIFTLTPDVIVVGGGVLHHAGLLGAIRACVRQQIGGYGSFGALAAKLDRYIISPALGDDAGALGGIALAMQV